MNSAPIPLAPGWFVHWTNDDINFKSRAALAIRVDEEHNKAEALTGSGQWVPLLPKNPRGPYLEFRVVDPDREYN